MTEWDEFKALDLHRIRKSMKRAVLVDMRNLLDPKSCVEAGFSYHGVGRERPRDRDASRPSVAPASTPANRKTQRRSAYVNGNGVLAEV
jgi:hypothetical protein